MRVVRALDAGTIKHRLPKGRTETREDGIIEHRSGKTVYASYVKGLMAIKKSLEKTTYCSCEFWSSSSSKR